VQTRRRYWLNRSLLGFGLVVCTSSFSSSQAQTAGSVLPAASGQKAVSQNSENAQPAREMEQLAKALSGIWSIAVHTEPNESSPKDGKGRGEEIWRRGPGGRSLIEEYHSTGDEGMVSGLGVLWWDGAGAKFQVTWCDNKTPSGCAVMKGGAKWDGSQLVIEDEQEVQGKKISFREVFSEITEKSFTQNLYQGERGGTAKRLVTITATKMGTSNDVK